LPADAPDPQIRSEVVAGRYVLVLGDPAGTAIAAAVSRDERRTLAQAITRARRRTSTGAASLESAVEDASQTTSKAEHAVRLFTEIAQGRLDPAAISDDVDALLGLLRRLDRDERWGEALRVARSLTTLLALLGRWVELLQSLQVALRAAEQLGDAASQAWGLHELGTLHLAAEKHVDADRLLSQAHDLRERIGDRRGLAMTDRNLQILCRALRARLHRPRRRALEQLLRRPGLALVFGILLLMAGAAAGAVIRGTTTGQGTRTVIVHAKAISKSIKPNTKPHTRFPLRPGPHPPTVTTGATSVVSQTAATLAASVNPNGREVSECKLEYGTSGSYSSSANCNPSPGSASSPIAVSASITGLAVKTAYHYRITATNSAGTSKGTDQTFTTLPNSPTITPPSAPTEVTARAGTSQASVSWSAPSSTGGSKITSYTVTPYAGASAQPPVEIAPPETSTIVEGLTNGASYSFTVTATNAVGAGPASEHSNAVTPHATIY
jgi:hypothetical protein